MSFCTAGLRRAFPSWPKVSWNTRPFPYSTVKASGSVFLLQSESASTSTVIADRNRGVTESLSIMAKSFVEYPALPVLDREGQRLGLLAPVRICFHQHGNCYVALQFGIEFVVGLEVGQALSDRMVLVRNPRFEHRARPVA